MSSGSGDRRVLGREIRVLEKTTSTNDVVAELGKKGEPEGVAVIAETQTAGRGRMGRKWESASTDGLWFSVLLRPPIPLAACSRLSLFAAVSVARALEKETGFAAAIKWPNDIFMAEKKVAGMLIESHPGANAFAVLGIGVNLRQKEFSQAIRDRATSLFLVTGLAPDRMEMAGAILRELDAWYPRLKCEFGEILAAAEARNYLRGRWIEAETAAGKITGTAEGLDENGALLLRKNDGSVERLCSGEVHLAHY